jgi:hypothetical protein
MNPLSYRRPGAPPGKTTAIHGGHPQFPVILGGIPPQDFVKAVNAARDARMREIHDQMVLRVPTTPATDGDRDVAIQAFVQRVLTGPCLIADDDEE